MKSFFQNKGPFDLDYLLNNAKFSEKINIKKVKISNISSLAEATENDITFFENTKYIKLLYSTNARSIFIKKEHIHYLKNKKIIPIISMNPLLDFVLIANIFYPDSNFDNNEIHLGKKYQSFAKRNILIDESALLGKGISIGPNTSIKKNVKIGNNVRIGSNCSISNTIIGNNVVINDGTVIGKIGFGFKYIDKKKFFIPHIGCVIIDNEVYIGSNCTIDRGSFTNTEIGSGTMIDNQVHIAHNCKIGSNCLIAGQVGLAGSTCLGSNCMIGGQAGISGHLKIGNNVYIGGGSGVLKSIQDGKKVMGYPATSIKNFLKGCKKH